MRGGDFLELKESCIIKKTRLLLSYGAGNLDAWVLKLDPYGRKVWEKYFGGIGRDEVYDIQQTEDGNLIVAGYTRSSGAGETARGSATESSATARARAKKS